MAEHLATGLRKYRSSQSSFTVVNRTQSHRVTLSSSSLQACYIPSPWRNNAAGINQTGSCSVCNRDGIKVINTTGLLRQHGPRDNVCDGSYSRPVPGSHRPAPLRVGNNGLRQAQSLPTAIVATITAEVTDHDSMATTSQMLTSSLLNNTNVNYPVGRTRTLKRIPKGARSAADVLLKTLINDILQQPSSASAWSKLLNFPGACLAKPNRGGKSRNLTSLIVKQVRQFELGMDASFDRPYVRPSKRAKLNKNKDELIAALASAKIEDGDIKGAVRLLCSNEELAAQDEKTFNELERLHPPAPVDRRSAPSVDTPPLQVSSSAVLAAIKSFPNGSAAGPDGLRPQHLKDLLIGASDDNPLLAAVTEITNLMLRGETPGSVRDTLFGANLLAISKKKGGVRPIAVGYVWRRLAAKVACSYVKEAGATLLSPRQLGFGVNGGAEASVRAARRYVENMKSGHLLIKTDFRNAFNTIRRDAIFEAVAKHFPELFMYVTSSMGSPSNLQFGNYVLHSNEGAQQGDPLGPLYFCLTIKELMESMQSELVLGYLDDITLGGDARTCLSDFLHLEEAAKRLGLEMNRSKCEVVGHTNKTRSLFVTHNVVLPETSKSTVVLLGAPLSAGDHLDVMLHEKKQELSLLTKRLELMPAHDSLFLLRNVLTAPRLMYLLRTAPCSDSPVLQQYDTIIRESLSATLNVDLDDDRWLQASLPVRWGGLGVRGVALLAPSAYLASAASTTELTFALLPAYLRHVEDSGMAAAKTIWLRHATLPSTPTITPALPTSSVQRAWDDVCCKVQSDILLDNAVDQVVRARLLAARSRGSGDWLEALPLSSVGLKMDNATIRIATSLRLGAPVVRPHVCVCGATVTVDGHHGLSCRHGSGRHSRHNQVNDLLARAFISTGTLTTREPHSLCTNNGKRPDGVTQVPWKRGRCLAWDATCPDTFAVSHLQSSSSQAGSAAATAELTKRQKYADIINSVEFVPVAIETSGVWGKEAWDLVADVGRRIATVTHEPRSTTFLRQRLSVAVQRGNACCILGTFRSDHSNSLQSI